MPPVVNPSIVRVLPDQFDPDPRLQELLDRLTSYYPRAIDPELGRTFRLLDNLGNPHLDLPPVIHVAGTNGKGSTLAFLRAMFENAGMSCHVMTSPHLVRFNERFVVAGRELSTSDILSLFKEVEEVNGGQKTTSFELITAAGFLAFSRVAADVALVEVGMGGRFDATNVIPDPALSILTSIAKDHVKFLGHDYSQIAFEKAGIIKPSVPCVVAPQSPDALAGGVMDVFEQSAEEKKSALIRYGHEWSFDILPDQFLLHYGGNIYDLPHPNLIGKHQFSNAATAAVAMMVVEDSFKKSVPLSAIENGIKTARWPARLQKLTAGFLVDILPDGWELWIDGGHNDGCGGVLAEQMRTWQQTGSLDTHVVLGMLNTKNPCEFAHQLLPLSASMQALTIPDQPLSLSGQELSDALGGVRVAHGLEDAVRFILSSTDSSTMDGGRILITGSLYLMGAVLKDHS